MDSTLFPLNIISITPHSFSCKISTFSLKYEYNSPITRFKGHSFILSINTFAYYTMICLSFMLSLSFSSDSIKLIFKSGINVLSTTAYNRTFGLTSILMSYKNLHNGAMTILLRFS